MAHFFVVFCFVFNVYGYFAGMYVCEPHACLVSTKVRGPLQLEMVVSCRVGA